MLRTAAVAVIVILILNVVVATVVTRRRFPREGWLPVILLGGTSMIAVIAVGTVLIPEAGEVRDRGIDAALVVALLAPVAAVAPVMAARAKRRRPAGDAR